MDFIMLGYRKNRGVCCLALMFSLVEFRDAGDSFVKIKKASLTYTDNKAKVTLEASLAFQLSDSVQEALHSGIVLYWDVFVSLKTIFPSNF